MPRCKKSNIVALKLSYCVCVCGKMEKKGPKYVQYKLYPIRKIIINNVKILFFKRDFPIYKFIIHYIKIYNMINHLFFI